MLHHLPPQRQYKRTTSQHYSDLLNSIPPPPPNTSSHKHIHNHIATTGIQNLPPNIILQEPPPKRHSPLQSHTSNRNKSLPCQTTLRSSPLPKAIQIQTRSHTKIPIPTLQSHKATPHTTTHILSTCTSFTQLYYFYLRQQGLWLLPVVEDLLVLALVVGVR